MLSQIIEPTLIWTMNDLYKNPISIQCPLPVMEGEGLKSLGMGRVIHSLLKGRAGIKKQRTIIVGLKTDVCSRDMLLRLINTIALPGDSVLAVHVLQQKQPDASFDLNTFHMHEDLCKSKQVDFEIKICTGSCYLMELGNQVRTKSASILALGCSNQWPEDSKIAKCLKVLPSICILVIINGAETMLFQSSASRLSETQRHGRRRRSVSPVQKSLPITSVSSSPAPGDESFKNINASPANLLERLALLEQNGRTERFTFEQLKSATRNFNPTQLIGESGHRRAYRAILGNGEPVVVKIFRNSLCSEEIFVREVEVLNGLQHDNIIQLRGYCFHNGVYAVVYNGFESTLTERLNRLKWSERMKVALGLAKALEHLHSRLPPIVHRGVNSSNILLSEDCEPQMSDFGAATVYTQKNHPLFLNKNPFHLIGTSRYLAPEYTMYGKVDEKIDVYSYGVVLLELITGKVAIQPVSNQENLVNWVKSLLTGGLYERLVDPFLIDDYDEDEMKRMITAARLCLMHSSSRRPTIQTILHFLQEPNYCEEGMHGSGKTSSNKKD